MCKEARRVSLALGLLMHGRDSSVVVLMPCCCASRPQFTHKVRHSSSISRKAVYPSVSGCAHEQQVTTHLPDRHGRSAPRARPLSPFLRRSISVLQAKSACRPRYIQILQLELGQGLHLAVLLRKEHAISLSWLLRTDRRCICEKDTTRGRRRVEGDQRHDGREGEQWTIQIGKKQQTNAYVIGPGMRGFLLP